ncbi:MAG TPA: ribosome rescue protein RqcH [Candidatus Thermoplasmatota archaeon]|nr:ribosome rescue protein RqcH [Candidatus Thermoplasmatota archaeon]
MKQGMTNVDVAALVAELRPTIVGARIDKVYQPGRDQVLLRMRRKGHGKADLLFELGRYLLVTKRAPANPDKPSMLAQVLRSALENARITAFHQVGFDRLVRMDVERGDGPRSLVFELFGDGNLLLLARDGTIELPMRGADFSARKLRKGEAYQPPPGSSRPFDADEAALAASLSASTKDVVRFLAVEQGFGPLWAEELCLRSGVPKSAKADGLDPASRRALLGSIQDLGSRIEAADLEPCVVHKQAAGGAEAVDAVPFPMQRYAAPTYVHEQADTFARALEAVFLGSGEDEDEEAPEDPRRARFDEARGKLEHQLAQIDEAIGRFAREEAERKLDGDALWASFQDVQAILQTLHQARADRSWAEVERVLASRRAEGNAWALRIPRLQPHEGMATLRVGEPPRDVEVDLRLSVQDNADQHYEAAKKARSRREGAQQARLDALGRIAELERKGLDAFGPAPVREERVQRHFWFESYRWTLTPSGLLAVGGRNAAQNDAVVKKYLRDGDRYVHADIHGAPSVVLRDLEHQTEPSEEDLRAAGQFAVCASRAWRQFGHANAYWVTAAQVSKTPRSGEFVPRGAWIVHGKRNQLDGLPTDWWVGRARFTPGGRPLRPGEGEDQRTVPKLVGGPEASVKAWCTDILHLVPGDMDANDAAQALAERFGVHVEEAMAVLPAGNVRIAEA